MIQKLRPQADSLNSSMGANLPSYLPLRRVVLREAVPVVQAAQNAAGLGGLMQRAQQSHIWLKSVQRLIPSAMQSSVQAGPVEEGAWVLLAAHPPAAAKLRQLAPALLAHLRSKGHDISEIRIKVAGRSQAL